MEAESDGQEDPVPRDLVLRDASSDEFSGDEPQGEDDVASENSDLDKTTLVMGELSDREVEPDAEVPDTQEPAPEEVQEHIMVEGVCNADCKCAACVAEKMAEYAGEYLCSRNEWLHDHPMYQDFLNYAYETFLEKGPSAAKWLTTIEHFHEWNRFTKAARGQPVVPKEIFSCLGFRLFLELSVAAGASICCVDPEDSA